MRKRTNPITHIEELLKSWPEISEDLLLLPEIAHRVLRRSWKKTRRVLKREQRSQRSRSLSGRHDRDDRGTYTADRRRSLAGTRHRARLARMVRGRDGSGSDDLAALARLSDARIVAELSHRLHDPVERDIELFASVPRTTRFAPKRPSLANG